MPRPGPPTTGLPVIDRRADEPHELRQRPEYTKSRGMHNGESSSSTAATCSHVVRGFEHRRVAAAERSSRRCRSVSVLAGAVMASRQAGGKQGPIVGHAGGDGGVAIGPLAVERPGAVTELRYCFGQTASDVYDGFVAEEHVNAVNATVIATELATRTVTMTATTNRSPGARRSVVDVRQPRCRSTSHGGSPRRRATATAR